jgi:hypothetical protein
MIFGNVLERAIEVEHRSLTLKTEEVKLVEQGERRTCLRFKRGWPPRGAQKLLSVGNSWTATTKIDINGVDAVRVKDDKIFVTSGPPLTYRSRWVIQLNSQPQIA